MRLGKDLAPIFASSIKKNSPIFMELLSYIVSKQDQRKLH